MSSRIVSAALSAARPGGEWVDARQVVVTDDAHPAHAARDRNVRGRGARDRAGAGPGRDRGRWRVRRRDARRDHHHAGPRRVRSVGGGHRCGASTPRRSRSGPTWTACSPPILASSPTRGVVPHLSFDEASELAYFGAKVLHPSTILPAVAGRHSGPDPEHDAAGHARQPDHDGAARPPAAADRDRLQAERDGRRRHLDAHAAGARLPAQGLRSVRAAHDIGGRRHHLRGQRLDDAGR